MIERELEFARIRSALGERSGHCGVVLTGDAGVGKTTLARHAAEGMDLSVRWVAGTVSARSIPLGVFAHLVGPATSSDPVTYLAAARESLLADGHPVIGVDDAHLLDELSATLLHQLAIDRAVHIIATVRSGESVPDAITSLWKDDHVVRVALAPFSNSGRISMAGDDCSVPAESCVPLTLVLHELATNALKYGALSNGEGNVSVNWSCDGGIRIDWVERNGPTVVKPKRRGLGSRLIARQPGLEAVDLRFEAEGVVCGLTLKAAA